MFRVKFEETSCMGNLERRYKQQQKKVICLLMERKGFL
jgi:hypothetical protein